MGVDPLTVGIALSAAASTVGAVSSYQQNRAASAAASENQAEAMRTAQLEKVRDRREARRKLASMRAAYGASGVLVGAGTPLEVLGDAAAEAEENIMLSFRQRVLQSRGFAAESSSASSRATSSLIGGGLSTGGTLLTGYGAMQSRNTSQVTFGSSGNSALGAMTRIGVK